MNSRDEILELEERLSDAELGPDQRVFQELLDDEVILVAQDGVPLTKAMVVEAHDPSKGRKFERVERSDVRVVEKGAAVVVMCRMRYFTASSSFALKFVRVWLRTDRWRIIAAAVYTAD